MESNRFQRILWTANGIFIFCLALFLIVVLVKELAEWMTPSRDDSDDKTKSKELEDAKARGLAEPKIKYDEPVKPFGSDYYILPVSANTPGDDEDYGYNEHQENLLNVIFIHKDMTFKATLTDKKIFIQWMQYPTFDRDGEPRDTIQRTITYKIATVDTDEDGVLGEGDQSDLYISGLDGSNFRQITSDIWVRSYTFLNRNEILIRYSKQEDIPEKFMKVFFAKYTIKENRLEELTHVHNELKKIEEALSK